MRCSGSSRRGYHERHARRGLPCGRLTLAVVAGVAASGACTTLEPQSTTYFDTTIDPILQSSCVRTNTGVGCHVADAKGNAFGNLDLVELRRRQPPARPAPRLRAVPAALAAREERAAVPASTVQLWDGTKVSVTTDIKHTGGPILDPTASGYLTCAAGSRTARPRTTRACRRVNIPRTPCSDVIPSVDVSRPPRVRSATPTRPTQDWPHRSSRRPSPVLDADVRGGQLPRDPVNALYLTCGSTPRGGALELLRRERSTSPRRPSRASCCAARSPPSQGGSYHEGGPIYASVNDPNYQAISAVGERARAARRARGLDPAFLFFAQMVQPILVKKGCMMAQCHSAGMFHEYRLRGGSAGSFSSTRRRRTTSSRSSRCRSRATTSTRAASSARTCTARRC